MTLVVADASAIVDVLSGSERAELVRRELEGTTELDVPEHFHVDVLSALRSLFLRRELSAEHAHRAVDALRELRIVRHSVASVAWEIWALRDRLTAYDAAYLVVAESIDARLLTTDAALAEAAGGRAIRLATT